jgi:hypothetical protein
MAVCFSQFNLEDKEVVKGGELSCIATTSVARDRTKDDRGCGNLKL